MIELTILQKNTFALNALSASVHYHLLFASLCSHALYLNWFSNKAIWVYMFYSSFRQQTASEIVTKTLPIKTTWSATGQSIILTRENHICKTQWCQCTATTDKEGLEGTSEEEAACADLFLFFGFCLNFSDKVDELSGMEQSFGWFCSSQSFLF